MIAYTVHTRSGEWKILPQYGTRDEEGTDYCGGAYFSRVPPKHEKDYLGWGDMVMSSGH